MDQILSQWGTTELIFTIRQLQNKFRSNEMKWTWPSLIWGFRLFELRGFMGNYKEIQGSIKNPQSLCIASVLCIGELTEPFSIPTGIRYRWVWFCFWKRFRKPNFLIITTSGHDPEVNSDLRRFSEFLWITSFVVLSSVFLPLFHLWYWFSPNKACYVLQHLPR